MPARNFFAVSRRLSVTSGGCYSSRTLEPQANEQLLRIELLGGFTVHVAGEGPRQLPARKARALLARLALPAGRPHSRESLTALLWGDNPEELARQAFRQTLSRLRRGLGGPAIAALLDRPDTVALDPGSVWVDAAEFEVAASRDEPTALLRAAALYRGDLLDGLDVDEPGFDEWRTVERERLRELALEALAKLLAHHMRADNLEPAVQTALHLLALDPLQEAVHRALMRLYARQGRPATARTPGTGGTPPGRGARGVDPRALPAAAAWRVR